jgi:hypothetical protein
LKHAVIVTVNGKESRREKEAAPDFLAPSRA